MLSNLNKIDKMTAWGVDFYDFVEPLGLKLGAFASIGEFIKKEKIMKEVSKKITVDLSRKWTARPIFAVQKDNGVRKLYIKITDDGLPYHVTDGTAVTLNYKHSDNLCGAIAARVEDGEVTVVLNNDVLASSGNTLCSVSLYDDKNNKITSSEFCLDVNEEFTFDDTDVNSPEYTLWDSIFAQMSAILVRENEREEAESIREAFEYERQRAEEARERRINSRLSRYGRVQLSASSWDQLNSQVITDGDWADEDMVIFYPESALDREICGLYGVFVMPESVDGAFTVSARVKPVSDIALRYYVIRGRLPEVV